MLLGGAELAVHFGCLQHVEIRAAGLESSGGSRPHGIATVTLLSFFLPEEIVAAEEVKDKGKRNERTDSQTRGGRR